MLQLQLKIMHTAAKILQVLCAATKIWHRQINEYFFKMFAEILQGVQHLRTTQATHSPCLILQ